MFRQSMSFLGLLFALLAISRPTVASADGRLTLPFNDAERLEDEQDKITGFPLLYQSRLVKFCDPEESECIAGFARIPNNRVLQATNLNCYVSSGGDAAAIIMFSGSIDDPASFDRFYLPSDTGIASINETILSFIDGGSKPKLLLAASGQKSMVCKLTGTLLKP